MCENEITKSKKMQIAEARTDRLCRLLGRSGRFQRGRIIALALERHDRLRDLCATEDDASENAQIAGLWFGVAEAGHEEELFDRVC